MKNKDIVFNQTATEKIKKGIQILSDAVKITLGPKGRNVIIEKDGKPFSTKDGVTVAKSIKVSDKVENMGIEIVKEAASQTADIAGDGTTTSTILAYELYIKGLKAINNGASPIEIKRGMEKTVKNVVSQLRKISKDIVNTSEIKQVATISSNNDEEIGKLISEAMEEVGRDGVITVEESKSSQTSLEVVEGMQFESGYLSPYFINNNNEMHCQFKDSYILITDKKISSVKEIIKILEFIITKNKPLLIIADNVEGEALATLIVNKARGTCNVCAIKSPGYGNTKKEMLEDIAVLTNGKVVSTDRGEKLDKLADIESYFGTCRTLTIDNKYTTIVGGNGEPKVIEDRVNEIKKLIDNASSDYEIEKYQDRLGKLIGGVAILLIGAESEVEMKEKKDRVDDALQATRAAVDEGIVHGGGIALISAAENINIDECNIENDDQAIGYKIVCDVCFVPFKYIIENAGLNSDIIKSKIDISNNIGYDVRTDKFVNLFDAGIIDPTKVTRVALEKAVSVASTLLITDCVITEIEDKKEIITGPGQLSMGM